MPKAKKTAPAAIKDLETPVAESGMPISVLFGTKRINGLNYLWFGDKLKHIYQVRS